MANLEIIVLDEGGGDLRSVVADLQDVRVVYIKNDRPLGFSGNHCKGINLARGKYIAFLHDDDYWRCDYLERTVAILENEIEVGVVLAGVDEVDDSGYRIGRRPARIETGVIEDPLKIFLRRDFMMLLPSSSVFRRQALDCNMRPWPDVIAADLTMYLDAINAGWRFYYLDLPLVSYRIHKTQIGSNTFAHRHALITIWSSYCYADQGHETRRKQRLAELYVARAGAWLRRRDALEARNDLRKAADLDLRSRLWVKRQALLVIAHLPQLVPVAERVWGQVRNADRRRHRG